MAAEEYLSLAQPLSTFNLSPSYLVTSPKQNKTKQADELMIDY